MGIPTLRPPHLPHPAHHTRRVQPAALLRLTLHVSVRCRLHPRRMASSRTPTRGSSFARCPSYQAQAYAPAFVYPFARRTAYTPPLLATSGHPVARDQLDQAGQDRRDQLLLLASRPVVLPHTRLAPAHTCIVSSYGKCKRYSTYSWRFTDRVTVDIQHPLLGRR